MTDWTSIILIIFALLNALSAVLAWIAKLRWSHEYAAAKDETIKAKEAQLETLRLQLQELKDLTPMKVREYYLSTKEQLEEYIEKLKSESKDSQTKIAVLQSQIDVQAKASLPSTQDIKKLEAEIGELTDRETKLNSYIDQLKEIADEFPFISIMHPAHILFIKKTPLNTLKYLFGLLDKLDPFKRDNILSWAYGPIIRPRYREPVTGKETRADLQIDEVSYRVFKQKCQEFSAVVEQRLLSFAIVSFTLQCMLRSADSTSLDEIHKHYQFAIEFWQNEENRRRFATEYWGTEEYPGAEDAEDTDKFVDWLKELQVGVEDRTKESYSLYEYFCEEVVAELLVEEMPLPRVKSPFRKKGSA